MQTVDVMIPVFRPDTRLERCAERLLRQTYPVRKITLILSVEKDEDEAWVRHLETEYGESPVIEIRKIEKTQFNHGGTRHQWASQSNADILLFMVQDAVPADSQMLAGLVRALQDPQTAVAYARHLPDDKCDAIERYARYFTYPPSACTKTWADVEKRGIDGCFTSNVCAAYRRDWYEKAGGFERRIPLSEDSVLAAKALRMGASVEYVPQAKVIHAHRFSFRVQWKRNFDIGVVHEQYNSLFGGPAPERKGARLIAETAGYLIQYKKAELLPRLFGLAVVKACAYKAGRHYERLPYKLVKKWSLDKAYWEEKE